MDENQQAVVLKLSISLETLAGERIARVQADQVFRDMFGEHVLSGAEAALHELLETQVVIPCRALIRMHVNKLQEQAAFTRLDDADFAPALIDGSISAALLARLEKIASETESG